MIGFYHCVSSLETSRGLNKGVQEQTTFNITCPVDPLSHVSETWKGQRVS